MILTLDIGNTNIKTALFDGKEMRYYWRMSTNIQKSSDEYGIVLVNLFQHVGVRPEEVEGIMISSVVPPGTSFVPQFKIMTSGCHKEWS